MLALNSTDNLFEVTRLFDMDFENPYKDNPNKRNEIQQQCFHGKRTDVGAPVVKANTALHHSLLTAGAI